MSRRLPDTEHTSRPWRIHEITPDFRVEDVWAFRTPGAGPDDFPAMLTALHVAGGPEQAPPLVRFLFAVRDKLAALFGWDHPQHGAGRRIRSLRERLPPDLRQAPPSPDLDEIPFTNLYQLGDEFAQELVIKTLHTVCHFGWVSTGNGDYELRMATLVRPSGPFGRLYMTAIKPFRHLIIYPAMTRQWERAWRDHGGTTNLREEDGALK